MAGQQHGTAGPFSAGPKILLALVPLLTLGLLGMVPAVVLAVRRRRAVDVLGAVAAGVLQLLVYVGIGLTDPDPDTSSTMDLVSGLALFALWLGGTAHFLAMDSRSAWRTHAPAAQPWYPQPAYQPYPQGAPYPPAPPQAAPPLQQQPVQHAPLQQQPVPQAPLQQLPVQRAPQDPATQDDLQQLGELLRRQAQEGRP